jgi:urease accessory protein
MNALTLLLLDSRAPTGASAHSAGLEAAVEAGWVRDLDDLTAFCTGRLRTSGRVAAAFAAAACADHLAAPASLGLPAERHAAEITAAGPRPGWRELDAEFEARTASEAMRTASRALGAGLRRLLRAMVPEFAATDREWGAATPHHPIVLGVACALTHATPEDAARAAALAVITTPATAAIRLLGLDPYAVHAMLANLATSGVFSAATAVNTPDVGLLPADTAIALDLLADVHLHQEVRLFAS